MVIRATNFSLRRYKHHIFAVGQRDVTLGGVGGKEVKIRRSSNAMKLELKRGVSNENNKEIKDSEG